MAHVTCIEEHEVKDPRVKGSYEISTTASETIKTLNKPSRLRPTMKNLARFMISVLLTGLENMGRAEAYCLGIDLEEPRKEE